MTRAIQILLALCAVLLSYAALARLWPETFAPPDDEIVAVTFILVGLFGLAYSLLWMALLTVERWRK